MEVVTHGVFKISKSQGEPTARDSPVLSFEWNFDIWDFSHVLRGENLLPKAYPIELGSFIAAGQHTVKFTFFRAQHQLGHTDKNDPGR